MDSLIPVILESWDRQTKILSNVAARVDDETRHAAPDESSWPIEMHLCHMHECRYGWLGRVSPQHQEGVGDVLDKVEGGYVPIGDLDEIRRQLDLSAAAVRAAVEDLLAKGVTAVGPYSHPFFFLQHMIWHEGYHFGLIALALRKAGQELPADWEEQNVWGIWRS